MICCHDLIIDRFRKVRKIFQEFSSPNRLIHAPTREIRFVHDCLVALKVMILDPNARIVIGRQNLIALSAERLLGC